MLAILTAALVALGFLAGPRLRIAGATSLLPLAESARGGLQVLAGGPVSISALGSSYGVASLLRRSADLALVDVPFGGPGLERREIARLTLAVIVAPGLPRSLSLPQLRAVLRGRVRSWAALGGPRRPVELVLRQHGSGLRTRLRQLAGGPLRPGAATALASGQVVEVALALPGGVGVVESGYAPQSAVAAVDGRRPGQAGYTLTYAAYAVWRRGDVRAAMAADLLHAVAVRSGE